MREFNACECTEIKIGRTSENDAEVVRFNVSGWPDLYGSGGAFVLVHRRPNEEQPYVCAASVAEDGWLEWVIQAADVEITGKGEAQLTYVINNSVAKSAIFTTRIGRSLGQPGELPEPYENMIEELIEAAADIVIVGQQVAEDKAAADADVLKAEGYAIGKQNGEDVLSDSPYYHNNSKYYAEQAGGSAQSAADSAGDANTAKGKAEDAQTAAETAQGLAEDAQAAAEAAAATFETDTTLSEAGKAADAKSTGDALDNYKSITKKQDRRLNIKDAVADTIIKLFLEIGYDSSGFSTLITYYAKNQLYTGLNELENKTLTDTGGISSVNKRYVSEYIDVSQYDTVYFKIRYPWGASFRMRICSYNEDKEFLSLLYSNATGNRNAYLTLNVSNASYLRFDYPSYSQYWNSSNGMILILSSYPILNNTYALDETVYGGLLDAYNGRFTSLYASNGELLETPNIINITPYYLKATAENHFEACKSTKYNSLSNVIAEYFIKTQPYIEEYIKIVESMITPYRENAMIATRSYSAGTLLIVDNILYKATSAIANGATLTSGTNVSKTSINAELALIR